MTREFGHATSDSKSARTARMPALARLMRSQARWALRRELGRQAADVVVRRADARYLDPPRLAATAPGRCNLEMAAYLLALRDSMTAVGYGRSAADRILAEALFQVMHRFYRPLDAAARLVRPISTSARLRWRQRISQRLMFRAPDWVMSEVPGPGGYGFDVRRCVTAEYMRGRGEDVFCRDVICRQDALMAEAHGETLTRPHTLAAGDACCDFRFRTYGVALELEPGQEAAS